MFGKGWMQNAQVPQRRGQLPIKWTVLRMFCLSRPEDTTVPSEARKLELSEMGLGEKSVITGKRNNITVLMISYPVI
jgi:hypothetical protein